jgi:uncharacterized protein YbaA (DUF1428 family)
VPKYVDGFVLAVPRRKLDAYRRLSRTAGKVWKSHGALEYVECVGDDLKVAKGCGVPFPRIARIRSGEAVVFSWIVYKSRAHRDRVNAKVMKDKRITSMKMDDPGKMPFDVKRMAYGGFKAFVDM